MASIADPIGASVVDYIQGNRSSEGGAGQAQEDRSTLEGLGLQPPSLILDACKEDASNIMLRGPRRSGRTNLAMNMAHSIAANASIPCRGECGTTCRCVAVAVLIPFNAEERFPLSCEHIVESEPQDLRGQLRALEKSESSSTKAPCWNKPALRRVQIHRMASARDVMEYLLSVQGKDASQQPIGGIIAEETDCFARGVVTGTGSSEQTHADLTTEQLMIMTQILVILADAANTLRHQTNGTPSCVALATVGEGVPWNVNCLWSQWFPTLLSIRTTSPTVAWQPPLDEGESVESSHAVEHVGGFADGTGKERSIGVHAHFVIVRRCDSVHRIAWKRPEP